VSESNDLGSIGPYRPIRQLGIGGQGEVYLAETDQGLRVAVKLLHQHLIANERALSRFLREMEIAKRVAPFCTAQLLDTGESGGRPYIVSEYVDGPSLRDSVTEEKDGGPRKGAALERLALNTVAALAGIHRAGVVHRDFNPNNVLLGPEGPVVIDFGVARALDLSQEGRKTITLMGTPGFMAPEQIENTKDIGREADVFAWGATVVFAATGEFPFSSTSLTAPLHEEPDLHGLDGRLGNIVRRCLDKDPTVRPTSAEVDALLRGQPAEEWISGLPAKPSAADEPPPDDRPAPEAVIDDEASEAVVDNEAPETTRVNTISEDAEELHSDRRKRRPLLIGAAVLAVLAILGIGYALVLSDQGERHDPSGALQSSTSPPSGQSGTPPQNTPTGGKSKQPSPHKTPPTQKGASTGRPPPSSDGGAPRAKSRKTIGVLPYDYGARYCVAHGYYYGGETYFGGPVVCYGSSDTGYRADGYSTTAVCQWKYPNHQNVRANGTNCTAYE
jgi:serine/threonine protein kinase